MEVNIVQVRYLCKPLLEVQRSEVRLDVPRSSLRHGPTRFTNRLLRDYACLTPSHGGGCTLLMDLGVLLSFSHSFRSPQPSGWTFPPPLSAARFTRASRVRLKPRRNVWCAWADHH